MLSSLMSQLSASPGRMSLEQAPSLSTSVS